MTNIKIVMGSVREGRFNDKAAQWISELVQKRADVAVEILDPKEWNLPTLTDAMPPSMVKDGAYGNDVVKKWAQKIKEADAYILVTPEYNHGTSAVLKNSLDHVYPEWNNKAVGFVGYGTLGGSRAVEHLRGIAAEMQMADVRTAVHIMAPWTLVDEKGALKAGVLDSYEHSANTMLDQLVMWAGALKNTRNS